LAEGIAFVCFCDTERILSPTAKFLVHLLGRTGAGSKGSGRGGERVVATPFYSVVIRPDELMSWWSVHMSVRLSVLMSVWASAFHMNHFFSRSCQPMSVLFIYW